jgi:hypothetical protein
MKQLIVVVLCLIVVGMYFSYSNREVELKNLAAAQMKANETIFDKMWKVVAQQAQVTDKYKDSFKEIYSKIMTERYSGKRGGALMSWVSEHNPEFSVKLYESLMDNVKGLREEFAQVQIKLIDINREHTNLRTVVPSAWFVGNRPELEIKIVTSEVTAQVFEKGKEDDIKVFK